MGLPLFLLSGLVTLGLIAPVMMLTSATPAVSVAAEGITIQPRVWRGRFRALGGRAGGQGLSAAAAEGHRGRSGGRWSGGRRYRAAEGKMLVIPSLPLPYRFTGLFAGEGFTGVIGLTNRTHTDYEALIKQVRKYTEAK